MKYVFMPFGEPVALEALAPGTLFRFGETIGLKTAGGPDADPSEAYVLGTGERFYGGGDPEERQGKYVQPLKFIMEEL